MDDWPHLFARTHILTVLEGWRLLPPGDAREEWMRVLAVRTGMALPPVEGRSRSD